MQKVVLKRIISPFIFLLVSCGGGGGGSNSDTNVTNDPDPVDPITIQNSAPTADAGSDLEVYERNELILDASNSSDMEGNIDSYEWKQINNGSYLLSIDSINSIAPTVTIPSLSDNQNYIFELIVTDSEGESSTDQVVIKARPQPEVIISEVLGNTASLNDKAVFTLKLNSRPTNNVDIPIISSNPAERLPDTDIITFTPDNWDQEQAVSIQGKNSSVINFTQNYQILVGPVLSVDSAYGGMTVPEIPMKGLFLSLTPPENTKLIANYDNEIQPVFTYTGTNPLTFSLSTPPTGMTIDASTGTIRWYPSTILKGQSFDINLNATDGVRNETLIFTLSVAQTSTINTSVQGNVLTVVDNTTNLNNLTIKAIDDPSSLQLELINENEIPALPDHVSPFTDIFSVQTMFDSEVELRIPLMNILPDNNIERINLFSYVKGEGVEIPFWSPIFLDFNFEELNGITYFRVTTSGLHGVYFFGTESIQVSTNQDNPQTSATANKLISNNPNINCSPYISPYIDIDFPSNKSKYMDQICYSDLDSEVRIRVSNFGISNTAKRWNGATINDLIDWIIQAQSKLVNLGLKFDKDISIYISDTFSLNGSLGYVLPSGNRKMIYLSNNDQVSYEIIASTAVHEYFHNAQGHPGNKNPSQKLLIDSDDSKKEWFIEGTAQWFEDFVFDNLNSYASRFEGKPIGVSKEGPRILETALNSASGIKERNPYDRFSFMKLLSEKCKNEQNNQFFNVFKDILNIDNSDPSGIVSLTDGINKAGCDFGDHFGSSKKSSLEAALAFYNYATIIEQSINLLDSGETLAYYFFDGLNIDYNLDDITDDNNKLIYSNT